MGCPNAVPRMWHRAAMPVARRLLWHEDAGLMGQFVVVAPGQTPTPPPDPYGD
jgi:hypothetical protein